MNANIKCTIEQRVKLTTLPSLLIGWFRFSLLQARNQLGTPGGAKSFLRGAQIFLTMCNNFKLHPTHFSRQGEKLKVF